MKKVRFIVPLVALLFQLSDIHAFDLIGKKESYLESRYINLALGLGFSEIVGYEGISGGKGFGFEIDLGHEFSQAFSVDFSYKFSLAGVVSNNPLDTSEKIESSFILNSESLRFFLKYPKFNLQPYVYAGAGMYDLSSVDSKTGMSFPLGFQIPAGVGFVGYIYKNRLSIRSGLDWHFLFGENQKQEILTLLNVNKVSFDIYSIMFTLTWHLF